MPSLFSKLLYISIIFSKGAFIKYKYMDFLYFQAIELTQFSSEYTFQANGGILTEDTNTIIEQKETKATMNQIGHVSHSLLKQFSRFILLSFQFKLRANGVPARPTFAANYCDVEFPN